MKEGKVYRLNEPAPSSGELYESPSLPSCAFVTFVANTGIRLT